MSGLPNGWVNAPLKSLLSSDGIFSDGDWIESKDQDPNGSIRLLQLADIGDGYFVDKSSRFVNEEKFAALNCTELKTGDVLIARMPDPLGRACLLPEMPQPCITVVDVAVFRTGKAGASNKWLMNAINSPQLRAFMETNSSGTTRKRIARGKLSDMELPVPPLNEQKRIADKLEAVLARVDACRDRLDRIPIILKRFRQSVLAAATSGKLTEGGRDDAQNSGLISQWRVFKICDLVSEQGLFSDGDWIESKDQDPDGGIRLIQLADIGDGVFLNKSKRFINGDAFARINCTELQPSDVLIARMPDPLGRACLFPDIGQRSITAVDVAILRPNNSKINNRWLAYAINAPMIREQMELLSSGTTRQRVTRKNLGAIDLSVPHIDEQHEIVRRVEALFAYADRLETRYQAARAQVEKLTPATLAKAFRGELVPQDPSDEPASELIERITVERALKAITLKRTTSKRKEGVSMKPRNLIPVIEALRSAKKPLSSQALLVEAGYPSDADTELVERFFLDIRKELEEKRIERTRKGNDDFFTIVP